jgi:hypothetical protein
MRDEIGRERERERERERATRERQRSRETERGKEARFSADLLVGELGRRRRT